MIEPTEEGRKLAADLAKVEGGVVCLGPTDFRELDHTITGRALVRLATRFLAMGADMAAIADTLSEWATVHGKAANVAKAYTTAAKYRKPKPDPLVEALNAAGWAVGTMNVEKLRDELAKRGIELKERGE